MKDKEFVLERFHFQTENGLVPAELQTEDGTKPFYVNIELTDAIRAAHELTSINQSTKDKFTEVISEHWSKILEYANERLAGQDFSDNAVLEAMVKGFEFYVENQELCDVFLAAIRSLLKLG
ncbi:hypothetical protein EFU53_003894 [Vibrio cholerae]|uniref:Uncharacterized protein n=1 Tax=Vibrio cholerae TaxID=666 RepID=A0A5C9SV38_VIBCL|nr:MULTISPECIES: hypothetical protein [Vibrio]HAS8237290.1 hypothetical protein [Vibrio vulnificus]EGQ7642127.1 hypothetical protein [Vibrio cholerae]EGR5064106.1 hypothetical protein [Vibrio cholerae]EJN3164254.1 hypothetical protein [Vibrio cholerae]EKF9515329.1 hypothetical protein [Vibrio cholerae]